MSNPTVQQQETQSDQIPKTRRRMPDFFPLDEGIYKKSGKNGKVIYMHPVEGKISCDTHTLFDILNLHLDALRKTLSFMTQEEDIDFGFLFETVIHNFEVHIDEVFELLEKDADIKNIEIHVVRRGIAHWRPGRVAGLTITKKEGS